MKNQNYQTISQELIAQRKRILKSKAFKKWDNHIRQELKKFIPSYEDIKPIC
jgi:hypothetical protein